MAERPAFAALAQRIGIAAQYVPAGGGAPREIAEDTRVALIAALGLDASSEASAQAALAALDAHERARGLPPSVVVREGATSVAVRADLRGPGWVRAQAELREESGTRREVALRASGAGRATLRFPALAAGYHTLLLRDAAGREVSTALLAAPARCWGVHDAIPSGRAFGIWANLYALRSEKSLGIGDFGALRELVRFTGRAGADLVGLSPLHALGAEGGDVSPYSPQSRWFRNPLYLEIAAIPELQESAEARALLADPALQRELGELRAAQWLDYDRLLRVQRPLLAALQRSFAARHRGRDTARGRAYDAYLAEQGQLLRDFATFRALEDALAAQGQPRDWRRWPQAYRDPRAPDVEAFREKHAEQIDFHAYVQFELDRQLAAVSGEARAAGLRIGLYSDLAIGSAPSGFDSWVDPGLFVHGVTLGAPPDTMAKEGQDWGFEPLRPARLAERGYADFARLLRANLRHTGALRIDHVLGLVRQWWVPAGFSALRGAYLRFPLEDLLAVLAIESQRARALIIGEDLGTVPKGLASRLAARGVLSLRVLLFERDRRGAFRDSASYSPRALTSANTHDLPTFPAFWSGRDLELRRELGLIRGPEAWSSALAERERSRAALLARLRREQLVEPGDAADSIPRLNRAVNAFLCRTPAPLVAVSLGDLCGEVEPVNLPGVPLERYRSWSRRMDCAVEALDALPGVHEALSGIQERARPDSR